MAVAVSIAWPTRNTAARPHLVPDSLVRPFNSRYNQAIMYLQSHARTVCGRAYVDGALPCQHAWVHHIQGTAAVLIHLKYGVEIDHTITQGKRCKYASVGGVCREAGGQQRWHFSLMGKHQRLLLKLHLRRHNLSMASMTTTSSGGERLALHTS